MAIYKHVHLLKSKKIQEQTTDFAKYYPNPQKVDKDFLKNSKVKKFRQIWSPWTRPTQPKRCRSEMLLLEAVNLIGALEPHK